MSTEMYTLHHISYSGIKRLIAEGGADHCAACARSFIATNIPLSWDVNIIRESREWEICEPEDSSMVSDLCGYLLIEKVANIYEEMY